MSKQYKKRILLSVIGLSPAVVTETLYALMRKNELPTEIRVITTQRGKEETMKQLLGIENGKKCNKGFFEQFLSEYANEIGESTISFGIDDILLVEDEHKNELPDIRTELDNQKAADYIVNFIGNLCKEDEKTQLHVSMAGGRKTMGFYAAYALSIFGRPQDKLSHVLVPEEYENPKVSFYYPTKESQFVTYKHQEKGEISVDKSKAIIELAEIPFVRLGLGLSKELDKNQISYVEAISKAQKLFNEPKIKFLTSKKESNRTVSLGGVNVDLAPKGYAFLLTLCILKKMGLVLSRDEIYKDYFLEIYSEVKDITAERHKVSRVNKVSQHSETEILDDAQKMFSESRNDIVKNVKMAFSISKTESVPYIPSATTKPELNVPTENIDLSSVKELLPPRFHSYMN